MRCAASLQVNGRGSWRRGTVEKLGGPAADRRDAEKLDGRNAAGAPTARDDTMSARIRAPRDLSAAAEPFGTPKGAALRHPRPAPASSSAWPPRPRSAPRGPEPDLEREDVAARYDRLAAATASSSSDLRRPQRFILL
jgi:hypothetical protein